MSDVVTPETVDASEDFARHLDATDPLREYRDAFHIPRAPDGTEAIYLCGNSLGLQPKATSALLREELDAWAETAVEGHFKDDRPWYAYHELLREPLARLVGAVEGTPSEVVAMNSLTVNLHLMMVSFYRPQGPRRRVLMEAPAFPSDTYAVRSHLAARGVDPDENVLTVGPREGESLVRAEDVEAVLAERGEEIALVLFAGVSFLTGQVFDLERLTRAGHDAGAVVGFDLAHAAGNVPLRLHDWGVDFACWCSYKYLNAGPGAIAGCFVHERHGRDPSRPRFAGWWGNDPDTRFRMHLERTFVPVPGADGWQISNPPILALAPLIASLELFDEAGQRARREKSLRQTAYLRALLEREGGGERFSILTPREDDARGCQLSIRVHDRPRERFDALAAAGVVVDFRPPDVIRAAPVPLYNTHLDCWRFAETLRGVVS